MLIHSSGSESQIQNSVYVRNVCFALLSSEFALSALDGRTTTIYLLNFIYRVCKECVKYFKNMSIVILKLYIHLPVCKILAKLIVMAVLFNNAISSLVDTTDL